MNLMIEINKEELVSKADTELLDSQIDQITDSFIEEHFLDNDEAEKLERLVAKSMKLSELYERKKWQEKPVPEGFVLLPIEPTKAIKTALSYQCFDFISVAQIYRDHGFDIPKRAEDEQSFFLHKLLILAIKHGDDFIKIFNAETKAMIKKSTGAKS